MAGWSGSGEERLHAGRAAPRVCNARPVLGLRSASQSLRRDRKCHTVWPNHSCCGNWNCTLPAFHLACRGGICQKQQTAALSQGQGARLRLRGHREGWEWAALSGAPETMEKSPGGGGEVGPGTICPGQAQASPSAGQGQSWSSDRVHGLCRDICCCRQSQIANSGFFLGDAGRASLQNSIISWRALGPPLISCQNGFLEKSLALERQNQRAQRHTMNTHHA